MASIAFAADPLRTVATLVPVLPISLGISMQAMRVLVDAVPAADRGRIVAAGLVFLGTTTFSIAAGFGQLKVRVRLNESIGYELDRRLIAATAGVHDIEHFERPEFLDRIEYLRTERLALQDAVGNAANTLQGLAFMAVTIILLLTVHPLLALLPIAAVPTLLLSGPAQRRVDDATERVSETKRRALHLFDIATSAGSAKETRVFGSSQWLLRRYRDEWRAADAEILRADLTATLMRSVGATVALAGYVLALVFLLHLIADDQISAGDAFIGLTRSTLLIDQLGRSAGMFGSVRQARNVAERVLWLLAYVDDRARDAPRGAAPARLHTGISLRDVTFAYAPERRPALSNINLRLPAGSVIAVVGENGAGKSTLMKLLFGFYAPTSGQVLVDDVDLATIDRTVWRAATTACFQDHAQLQLPVREAIGVGSIEHIDDDTKLRDAAGRAAALGLIDQLADGLDHRLGALLDGADLSGGQWQKLSISRAMMRTEPVLLALDEPTSALDPLAEHELLERYDVVARQLAQTHGTITLLVAHRFSTVRFADHIVVLHEGQVLDAGTHDDLMGRCPHYAELFTIQARQYH
ncbi:MAG TPA: ABC transporter ATP-binding protein [Acidimicrobiales bacterium]|nr:ABC transporter ATP-binding protein [Acidimicrobiales bacterium]